MPIPDDEMLGPDLEKRLKGALDNIVPPSPLLASARYRMGAARGLSRAWRFAPALVAVSAAGFVLTATAATGSPNPAIWRDRAGTVLQSVSHFPSSTPNATHSPKPKPQGPVVSHPTPSSGHEAEPSDRPEPTDRPGHSPKPSPSPEPTDHPEASPTPDSSNGTEPGN